MKNFFNRNLKKEEQIFLSNKSEVPILKGHSMSLNGNYLAISNDERNGICVFPSYSSTSKPKEIIFQNVEHNLIDLNFYPFNDDILISTHENNSIIVSNLYEESGKLSNIQIYQNHKNFIPCIAFNPVVSNLVSSIDLNKELHIWDITKNDTLIKFDLEKEPLYVEWNQNGSLLGVIYEKDNSFDIMDPRENKKNSMDNAHTNNSKLYKIIWLTPEKVITFIESEGMQKISLFDLRKSLENKLDSIEIKTKNRIIPFLDNDCSLLYNFENNAKNIMIYDVSNNNLNYISSFMAEQEIKTQFMFQRKTLNYQINEVDRFAILTNDCKNIKYIRFLIKYDDKRYQKIYSSITSDEPALNYVDWLKREDSEPKRKDIKLIENKFMDYEIDYKKLYEEAQNKIEKLQTEKRRNKKNASEDDQEDSIRENIIKDIRIDSINLYDKYILDTEPLSENKNISVLTDNGEIIGRIFLNKNSQKCYYEIFYNKKLNLINRVSDKITFLHPPENDSFNKSKFIGFRYYKRNHNDLNDYFTLINKCGNKYYILEKERNTKFYNEKLNCFNIMQNIIYDNFKSQIILGEPFPELIGFCYSLTEIDNKREFFFLPPYIPDIQINNSLLEELPNKLYDFITYIEPIIYDSHVSLLIFKVESGERKNILMDMSRYHSKRGNLDKIIFPKEIRNSLDIYPKIPIQIYNSCALWLYGQIELIINNEEYKGLEDFHLINDEKNYKYYLDVINLISTKLQGASILEINKINNKQRFYTFHGYNNLSIGEKIIYNYLIDFGSFLEFVLPQDSLSNEKNFIIRCQNIFQEYLEFINLVDLNNNYKKCVISNWKIDLSDFKKKCNLFIENFNFQYLQTFEDISEQSIYFILKSKQAFFLDKTKEFKKEMSNFKYFGKVIDFGFVREFAKALTEIKDNFNYFTLYNEDSVLNFINSSQNIIFKIMNK